MFPGKSTRPISAYVMFAIVAVLTVTLVATSPPTVTTDSVGYVAASESIRKEPYQIRDYDGTPFVRFAPLYSLYLAAVESVSPFPLLTNVMIGNAMLYAATLWFGFRLMKRVTGRRDTLAFGVL